MQQIEQVLALARDARDASGTARVAHIGGERQPLLIVDDAMTAPNALVEFAATQSFRQIGPYFPGVRTRLPDAARDALCASLAGHFADAFDIDAAAWTGELFFSIVTTPPERLLPIQRFPHYDGVEPDRLALLYYLCPPDFGGTAFFRHRSTGFETVSAARFPTFKDALENDVRRAGMPPARYVSDGAPFFEKIFEVEPVFNRLIAYRGHALHCSAIDNSAPLPDDPRAGRLTLNGFLTPRRDD